MPVGSSAKTSFGSVINARATARNPQSLFVNQFEQERVADVGLILDARRQSDVRTGDGALCGDLLGELCGTKCFHCKTSSGFDALPSCSSHMTVMLSAFFRPDKRSVRI